jgi:5-methylcytosine-specific restriction endonuclease McrA
VALAVVPLATAVMGDRNRHPPLFRPPQQLSAQEAARRRREALEQRQRAAGTYRTAAEKGYDWEWQKLSREVRQDRPWCEDCLAVGRRTPTALVDHILNIREHPDRRLDPSNLRALCRRCHAIKSHEVDGVTFGPPRRR